MKLKVFKSISKNGKPYWSIPAKNYKDENDRITYFVSFAKDVGEPLTSVGTSKTGNTYQYANIDVLEMIFGCFNKNPQLTILKYVNAREEENEYKFGGQKSSLGKEIGIETDNLPFY